MPKHINIVEQPHLKRLTKIWLVENKYDHGPLGHVKWFGRWRCYSFFPNAGTVFEKVCLRDIAEFCEQETSGHRKRKEVDGS